MDPAVEFVVPILGVVEMEPAQLFSWMRRATIASTFAPGGGCPRSTKTIACSPSSLASGIGASPVEIDRVIEAGSKGLYSRKSFQPAGRRLYIWRRLSR